MGKLPKPASKYLRPEDGDTIEITAHPQTIPAEETRYGKERHVIPIQLLDGTEKQWGLNQTSYRTLYDAFGDEGDNWIGRKVSIIKNREKVRGETRHVLYAEPANKTQPKQASLTTDQQFRKQLEALNIKPEAFNQLSGEEQAKLLRKMSMQQ